MKAIVEQEIELARRQFQVARRHSTIAYEASNHYYYFPQDLIEKYGVDQTRYALMREATFGHDGDISYALMTNRINAFPI